MLEKMICGKYNVFMHKEFSENLKQIYQDLYVSNIKEFCNFLIIFFRISLPSNCMDFFNDIGSIGLTRFVSFLFVNQLDKSISV